MDEVENNLLLFRLRGSTLSFDSLVTVLPFRVDLIFAHLGYYDSQHSTLVLGLDFLSCRLGITHSLALLSF